MNYFLRGEYPYSLLSVCLSTSFVRLVILRNNLKSHSDIRSDGNIYSKVIHSFEMVQKDIFPTVEMT